LPGDISNSWIAPILRSLRHVHRVADSARQFGSGRPQDAPPLSGAKPEKPQSTPGGRPRCLALGEEAARSANLVVPDVLCRADVIVLRLRLTADRAHPRGPHAPTSWVPRCPAASLQRAIAGPGARSRTSHRCSGRTARRACSASAAMARKRTMMPGSRSGGNRRRAGAHRHRRASGRAAGACRPWARS